MYNQNLKNQVVKEVKNGSTISATSIKFGMSKGTIVSWVKEYDEKMHEMMRDDKKEEAPAIRPIAAGIKLKSIKVQISGAIVTLRRNDVLKMLKLFDVFDGRAGEE